MITIVEDINIHIYIYIYWFSQWFLTTSASKEYATFYSSLTRDFELNRALYSVPLDSKWFLNANYTKTLFLSRITSSFFLSILCQFIFQVFLLDPTPSTGLTCHSHFSSGPNAHPYRFLGLDSFNWIEKDTWIWLRSTFDLGATPYTNQPLWLTTNVPWIFILNWFMQELLVFKVVFCTPLGRLYHGLSDSHHIYFRANCHMNIQLDSELRFDRQFLCGRAVSHNWPLSRWTGKTPTFLKKLYLMHQQLLCHEASAVPKSRTIVTALTDLAEFTYMSWTYINPMLALGTPAIIGLHSTRTSQADRLPVSSKHISSHLKIAKERTHLSELKW